MLTLPAVAPDDGAVDGGGRPCAARTLHCAVQCCAILHRTMQYCIAQTILYSPVQSTVKHTAVLYNIVLYSTVLYCGVLYNTVITTSAVLYCTALYCSAAYNDEQDYAALYCAIYACPLCMHVYCTVYVYTVCMCTAL